ncbi:MAG: hypothetical protein JJD93_18005 [Ilumatobacteraceae bacterium]|nr:hypothetical protein [Ilumatobacteraceae bacterium]
MSNQKRLVAVLVVWWNFTVFSLYAIVFVPFEFVAVVFLMIGVTVVRSLCQQQGPTGRT